MPGSPRVERAANIRIQHPNLSTEDAMKLAGFDDDEAKDPKRQSNVRQKTHRLTKGRNKRQSISQASGSDYLVAQDNARQRLSLDGRLQHGTSHEAGVTTSGDFLPLPIDYDGSGMHSQPFERPDHMGQMEPAHPSHYNTPQRDPRVKSDSSTRQVNDIPPTPGSARAEKAARFWLDNPNLSIEHAMKLAGYPDEEIKSKYRQNDIRQTAHQMTIQIAAKANKNAMSNELRGRLSGIERKMDDMANRLERTVDVKLKELGARIDDKFNYLHQHIHIMVGGSGNSSSTTSASTSGYPPYSHQQHQQHRPQGSTYPPTNSGYPPQSGPGPGQQQPHMYSDQNVQQPPHPASMPMHQSAVMFPPHQQGQIPLHARTSSRSPDDTIAL
uniref:Uncharacterized protein n=1 Tax=Chaetoceros debilis TaxID=122233 RepID=A0A7S3QBE1_9STRA|mmetsp:Transcript_25768/g.38074  ORF Transcript_25768/g.38074 Transcript_25768/m.38074 type:complete len:384 (+) Transcript_25768:136-1287(+)|eukprot:CAMPEP_0194076224 /NCGR_PEP_ID=MMETSP0149-20130528/3062_1 /TAXON_ID=122233 /ORGANISM="Chaetoceros debilis, Strain MM31A-1" /LENGTH=383 /DNA_ID=CAMNT_0038756913 /DNA_START=73 /DNA_END=1224 /DNA_ORIENTATION=-